MHLPLILALTLASAAAASAADLRTGFRDALELDAELRGLVAHRSVVEARRQGSQALLPGHRR